ncbi:MAG TPA: hypothetical protein DCK76_03845 [Desulfotomaculum sp.]|nr:MAG: SufBD protein [Desulfotomaculum sp. 46_80]HAG10519.1 hypothetical protein [Desulfotomaculum sp.]HBY04058.1 hypothetical protein [Desulfotomaculum sp.]
MKGAKESKLQKARDAAEKKALFGEDLDLGRFIHKAPSRSNMKDLSSLSQLDKKELLTAGVDPEARERSGSFMQIDHSVVHHDIFQDGLEIMSTSEAREKYDWLEDYYWHAVAVDTDKYTARAELHQEHGYFIRALPGVKTAFPLQACLFTAQDRLAQEVHNIVIAEEGSELHIISGCASSHNVKAGLHIGVSEFYVKKGARLSFTMIHNWAEEFAVRPRSATIVEEDGVFLSNYVCMKPVKTLQMYPTTYLSGANAVARYNTILVAVPGSFMDVGSRVYLKAHGTKAEMIARTITTGGDVINRGHIVGEVADSKGHLECHGLILSEKGLIYAVPELEGRVSGVDLSHEAAVGKIAQEEIEYMMSRGMSESDATAAIVRGFLNVDIMGLPSELKEEIDKTVNMQGMF